MKNKEVMLSGIFTGISGLFARAAMINTGEGFAFIQTIIFEPMIWLSCITGVLGFAYLQIALHRNDVSFVGPVVSSIGIITPVILAVIFLNEYVPPSRWVGVGLMLLGITGFSKETRKA